MPTGQPKILLELGQTIYLNSSTHSYPAVVDRRLTGVVIIKHRDRPIRIPNPLPYGYTVQYGNQLLAISTEPPEVGDELRERFELNRKIFYLLGEISRMPVNPSRSVAALRRLHTGLEKLNSSVKSQYSNEIHESIS